MSLLAAFCKQNVGTSQCWLWKVREKTDVFWTSNVLQGERYRECWKLSWKQKHSAIFECCPGNWNFEFLWQTGLESHSLELYPLSIFFIYLLFLHVLLHTLLTSQCLCIEQEFCQKHVYGWRQYNFWGGRQV